MEAKYSKQLIENLKDNLDPQIINFFNKKGGVYHFPETDLEILTENTLIEYLKGQSSKEDVAAEIRKIKKNRSNKKNRWYKSYISGLSSDNYENPSHPLYAEVMLAKSMSEEEFYNIYKVKDISGLSEIKKAEAKKWLSETESFFIHFPGLHLMPLKSVYSSFKNDVISNIWSYIEKNLDGNINMYMSSFPETFIGQPLFSPTSFTLDLEENNDNLVNKLFDEVNNEILTLTVPSGKLSNPLKVMDSTDQQIVSVLIANTSNSFFTDNTVVIDKKELFKKVSSAKRPNAEAMERFDKRLDKLTDYNHTINYNGGQLKFNFFDHIDKRENVDGSTTLFITFGDVISDQIINNKLINVTRDLLVKLKNPLSKILLYSLQKARITALQNGKEEDDITYNSLLRAVRFKTKNKKNNLVMIQEAMQEMTDAGAVISSYKYEDDFFHLTFIPFSQAEATDLILPDNLNTIDIE